MKKLIAAALLCLGSGAHAAQTITMQLPCVSAPEAEALITSILPETIEQLGSACAGTLPPGALLRQPPAALIARYRADADAAWPGAQKAVQRLAGDNIGGLLSGSLARPLIASLLAPAITRAVQPGDCPAYDRIVTLAQPLPPRNLAGLLVAAWELADARKRPDQPASGIRGGLSICKP